jgi:hypothetical protein
MINDINNDQAPTTTAREPKLLNLSIMSHGPEAKQDKVSTFDDVCAVPTPQGTPSWRPMSHGRMIETLENVAEAHGAPVINSAHLLGRDGQRYFGLFQVNLPTMHDGEIATMIGLRNSHDKAFRAGIMAGDAPFICSNLAFNNEIVLGRKHTAGFSLRVLQDLMLEAFSRLIEARQARDIKIERMKNHAISDRTAHDVIINGMRAGACAPSHVGRIAEQWHNPEHETFAEDYSVWRLHNAFTNVWRGAVNQTPQRSAALNHVIDSEFALN